MALRETGSEIWPGARVLVLSPTPTHPQDYGNRKRIFQVCDRLKSDGARITFVHYPAEREWREVLPLRAERAMTQAWARYYTIGPTRELHAAPSGRYHGIDDWWDEAIGEFLRWLFSVQSFDVFIVNYTWLSKAFECAPRSVFKILDTHDKFSGRREVLESLGLQPDFFYTTEDQERIALRRADLIWAIKKEEQALFERMSPVPVLTMPHVDPYHPFERAALDPDGYFRVGVVGARNNINHMNISEFLKVAEPVFRDAFAAIRVEIAGTVCEMFREMDGPFVRLRGRVEDMGDFYRTVDCVAIPMRASTGLKIKTGEAISLGMPVVSLAHAFEGYEPCDRVHSLPDFSEMARVLVDLSFAPRNRLAALAAASAQAHAKTHALVTTAFEETRARSLRKQRSILLVVDSRAFAAGTIFSMVSNSTFEYLNNLGNVTVLVVRGAAADIVGNEAAIDHFRKVVVSADLDGAAELRASLAAMGVDIHHIRSYLRLCEPQVLVLDALHPALFDNCCENAFAISRMEMIALSEGGTEFRVPCEDVRRAVLATPQMSADVADRMADGPAELLLIPCLWRSTAIRFLRSVDHSNTRTVVLLGSPKAPAVLIAAAIAQSWGLAPHIVCGVGDDPAVDNWILKKATCQRAGDYLAAVLAGRTALPSFAIDLGAGELGLPLCREFLDRLEVPTVTTSPVGIHPTLAQADVPVRATTEKELWDTFRSFALGLDPNKSEIFRRRLGELQSDGGWAWLWRQCTRLFETNDMEFA